MGLLRSQKNELFEMVGRAGLDPRDFAWEERDALLAGWHGTQADTLVHRGTGFSFMVFHVPEAHSMQSDDRSAPGDYVVRFEPGADSRFQRMIALRWDTVAIRFYEWLERLKREASAPDLWAQLAGNNVLDAIIISVEEPRENTAFTIEEQTRIADTLQDIKARLEAQYDLSADQVGVLTSAFDRLVEAAARLGRTDWKQILLAAVITVSVEAGLKSDVARTLAQLAGEGLRWLFQHGRLLPS